MKKTIGLIAAPYTPFNEKGRVDSDQIPAYAGYLRNSGVRGVFVNGTTGESASLTVEERIQCAASWSEQRDDQFKVIIHVGHNSVLVSQQLAIHAQKIGADAIGLMAPNFYKPENLSSLIAYNVEVAGATPELPYYYYHMPAMSGVSFPMMDFLRMAEDRIPNLAGIKFTHEDLMEMKLCIEYNGQKFDILHGRDEILLCGLVLGAKGAIGSTYNFMAPLYIRIIEAFNEPDLTLAKDLQYEAIKILNVLNKYGGSMKAGKSVLRLIGLDFGNPRLPLNALTLQEEAQLHQELEVLGFSNYSNQF